MKKLGAFILMVMAVTLNASAGVYVISDNDDTLEISGIRTNWANVADLTLIHHKPFAGMPLLYQILSANGLGFQYLSGSPAGEVTLHFLHEHNFPDGPLTHRPNPLTTRPSEYPNIEDFKVEKGVEIILKIVSTDPNAKIIFTGDNGEKDPLSFSRIMGDTRVAKYIKGMFVHLLYSEKIGTPLGEGQIGYVSPAELALRLLPMKILSQEDVQKIATEVANAHPLFVVPSFGTVTQDEAGNLEKLAEQYGNAETKEAVGNVVRLEQSLCANLADQI